VGCVLVLGLGQIKWRNRSGFGWLVLALIITPPLAFIFCAIVQPKPARIASSSPS
jgi:hypothetical protein